MFQKAGLGRICAWPIEVCVFYSFYRYNGYNYPILMAVALHTLSVITCSQYDVLFRIDRSK